MTDNELPLADEAFEYPVVATRLGFQGKKWSIQSDEVDIDGDVVTRDVLRHPGAVAVAAVDEAGRLLLIRQYRHPMSSFMWEIPAGLLDIAGEDRLECAKRELAEEAGVTAQDWSWLLELALSPGGTSERITIFRASGLHIDPESRPVTGEAEERHLPQKWVTLAEATARCLDGSITNATAVAAILALAAQAGPAA
jgi:ADP-ribose pyrophosphatase